MPIRPSMMSELRLAVRWAIGAAAAAGVFWGGGYLADAGRPETDTTPCLSESRQERSVRREAARGVAQLERFLAQQPHG
jgi:hypothetical protein